MNIPNIEATKTLTVTGNWLNTNSNPNVFEANINVEFIPDEIILKAVSYYDIDTNLTDPILSVRSEFVDGFTLVSFTSITSLNQYYNTRFRNFKPIQGSFKFEIVSYTGGLPANIATLNSVIAMTFEFNKYKKNSM